MFRRPGEMRERVLAIAEQFRQKGATSPEKAMTAQELGLPLRFEEAMKRRLGRTGIFVDVGGRYYLDEARLSQFERGPMARPGAGSRLRTLRMSRMLVGVLAVALALLNFLLRSWYVWAVAAALMVVWIALTVLDIYYMSRVRGPRAGARAPGPD
jgi:hypothetical protein